MNLSINLKIKNPNIFYEKLNYKAIFKNIFTYTICTFPNCYKISEHFSVEFKSHTLGFFFLVNDSLNDDNLKNNVCKLLDERRQNEEKRYKILSLN